MVQGLLHLWTPYLCHLLDLAEISSDLVHDSRKELLNTCSKIDIEIQEIIHRCPSMLVIYMNSTEPNTTLYNLSASSILSSQFLVRSSVQETVREKDALCTCDGPLTTYVLAAIEAWTAVQ